MSFSRYPKYKDSGVEWLGEVPGHWPIRRVRWLCEIKKRISGELGHDVLSITQQGIKIKDLESNDGQISMDYSKYQFVEVGDFAMNHMDLLTGYVDVSPVHGVTSPDYRVFTIRDQAISHEKYLLYLFQMGYKNKIFYAYGQGSSQLGRWRLPTEQFNDLPFPLPPKSEQQNIAAFLDRETAKIDELVAEQQRLMELLKEKRQAVISHAVTKGLNPDAPMKPSGIEWLGDVPAHWERTPIKYVAKVGNGSTPSREIQEYWGETGFPWLNSSVVNSSVVTKAEGFVTERALRECHLPVIVPPAILVGITGQGRTRGMAAMLGIEATINQHVAYVKPSMAGLDVHYLLRVLESAYLKLRRDSEEAGATKGAITCEQIKNLHVPLPPLVEQCAISAFLDTESAKFNSLTAEAQRAIDLLQERRTALISAAVTGQIDVRAITSYEL